MAICLAFSYNYTNVKFL